MTIHIYSVLVPFILLLAALFAAGEASLLSLTRSQLETLRETRPGTYRRIQDLVGQPDVLLSTVVVGNEFLNIMIGTFVATLIRFRFGEMSPKLMVALSVLVTSALLLTFSEILPKLLAFRMPVLIASVLVYPMSWARLFLTPVRRVFLGIAKSLLRLFGIPTDIAPGSLSEKDFLTMVEAGAESGSLDRDEKDLIFNVFHFSDMTVSSVMTPWSKVFWVPDNLSVEELIAEVKKRGFSRIPIVSGEGDVAGILYAKELLKLLLAPEPTLKADILQKAVFPPYIVSTHKKISKLFREFKLKKVHFALVVDEYGNHLGVVTLEDVLNALFHTQRKRVDTVLKRERVP